MGSAGLSSVTNYLVSVSGVIIFSSCPSCYVVGMLSLVSLVSVLTFFLMCNKITEIFVRRL